MGQENIYYCIGCGTKHDKGKFYKSYNLNHKNGVYPFCKKYIKKEVYTKDKSINVEKFKNLLMQMDAPFLKSEFEGAVKEKRDTIGAYFTRIKMKQNRDYTWKDSTFEDNNDGEDIYENDQNVNSIIDKEKIISSKQLKKLQDKYGYGYTDEEYLNFERKYKKLSRGYKEKTAIHTERFLDYIVKKVKEEMATAKGDVVEAQKWEGMAKTAATAAKLNVSQLSKSDITGGIDLIPQLVETLEERVSLIPIMPKLKEQPYDDADLIIWAIINKLRRIEDKPTIKYKDIWIFYDEMIKEYYKQKGYNKKQIEGEINKRLVPFRDLDKVYIEPLYDDENNIENNEDGDDIDAIL